MLGTIPRRRLARRLVLGLGLVAALGCTGSPATSVPPQEADDAATHDRAEAVATAFVARHPPSRLPWSWRTAILGFGLARLAETDPAAPWTTALLDFYAAHPEPKIDRPDDCAPAIAAAWLLQQGHDSVRPVVERVAEYLRSAPRNALGALDHLDRRTALGRSYPASIWVDSLVMYAVTAAMVGRALGDRELLAFAHAQPVIFATHLQDPSSGLFRHAYLVDRQRTRPEAEVFWLRGNGWVALALVELLDTMDPAQPEHYATRVILGRLADGLHEHRTVEGTWPTVLDDRRAYEEPSGTALVAYALAKAARRGWLPAWHRVEARQTLRTLEARLRERRSGPVVVGTSTSTIPSRRAGYVLVPRAADVPYGVGAYLLLAAELRRPDRDPP